MSREGILSYEDIYSCQILDKYNLTDRKVPALTIKGRQIRFNLNAIHMLGDPQWVKILVNPDEKYILVLPSESELDVYAVDWCKVSKKTGRLESKDVTSKFLSPKLYNLMNWDREHSYKLQCIFQDFGEGRTLLYFDMTEYVTMVTLEQQCANGTVRKRSQPYYLANWKDSFGPPLKKIMDQVTKDYSGYYAFDAEDGGQATVFKRNNEEVVTDHEQNE